MKNSKFWIITLCTFLGIASVNGWTPMLRVAVIANALVVLLDAARSAWALFKREEV